MISNGTMKGGGTYFLISRSVGPELGGAIGVLFYLAYAVGTTFYISGFAEGVITFLPEQTIFSRYWLHVLVGTGALLIVLTISLIGAEGFTKVNVPLFVVQFSSIMLGIVSIYFQKPQVLPTGGNYTGWHLDRLEENTFAHYHEDSECGGACTFPIVLGILFPAVTGIMEGANLSGDLEKPQKSIWKGTLIAILISFVLYVFLILTLAGGFTNETLRTDVHIFQGIAFGSQYLVVAGLLISTFSSALGASFGGSRLLQALARDELFPKTSWLGVGSGSGDEPRRAVLVTWAISQACLMIGKLDAIAPIIDAFFLLSYGFTNFACFLVTISGSPNWRPRFRYFTWWTSALGVLLSIFMMFFLSVIFSLISIALFIALFVYLVYRPDLSNWGDVRMALVYHQVRKYLLQLSPTEQHGKLWRPSVMLLVRHVDRPVTVFCKYLKKGGIYILGGVCVGAFDKVLDTVKAVESDWRAINIEHELKAFPQIVSAPSIREGYQNLLLSAGLGAMTPNIIVIEPPSRVAATPQAVFAAEADDFVGLLADIANVEKNVVVACNFSAFDFTTLSEDYSVNIVISRFQNIYSWKDFEGTPLLQLGLGNIMEGTGCDMKLVKFVSDQADVLFEREALFDNVKRRGRFRVGKAGSQISVVVDDGKPKRQPLIEECIRANKLILREVDLSSTNLLILALPERDTNMTPTDYMKALEFLIEELPPTLLVAHNGGQQVMSTDM
eukprot:TRINITY_DN3397_c0_g1_i1.p1 TRINITY_DN3397_c0_g1~~TRINITY_DN3397_c0_g1_i1.p1  ORF type:complete len:837 (+),score=144.49 TRINITY_DN3397_c0_g1_i1:333-2513(+)